MGNLLSVVDVIVFFMLLFGTVAFVFSYDFPKDKPEPKIQYSSPIGPTQSSPYRLEAEVIPNG